MDIGCHSNSVSTQFHASAESARLHYELINCLQIVHNISDIRILSWTSGRFHWSHSEQKNDKATKHRTRCLWFVFKDRLLSRDINNFLPTTQTLPNSTMQTVSASKRKVKRLCYHVANLDSIWLKDHKGQLKGYAGFTTHLNSFCSEEKCTVRLQRWGKYFSTTTVLRHSQRCKIQRNTVKISFCTADVRSRCCKLFNEEMVQHINQLEGVSGIKRHKPGNLGSAAKT